MPESETSITPVAGREIRRDCTVPVAMAGTRLDQALAQLFPEFSRSRIQQWIRAGEILVDGHCRAAKARIGGGERIQLNAVLEPEVSAAAAQALEFGVVFSDEHLLVIDKPAGLVMHPAAGNRDGTLMNGLLHLDAGLAMLPRAGIVHRLDKDTTGLLVVARTLEAHTTLVAELQARRIHREYLALVNGEIVAGGTVDAPIGRHPVDRKRMAVNDNGRPARTHYRVAERLHGFTLLHCILESGRTHQIRVHLAHIGHAVVGDPVYAGRLRPPAALGERRIEALRGFRRQALHARRLGLIHPASAVAMNWEAPLPVDFSALLDTLRQDD